MCCWPLGLNHILWSWNSQPPELSLRGQLPGDTPPDRIRVPLHQLRDGFRTRLRDLELLRRAYYIREFPRVMEFSRTAGGGMPGVDSIPHCGVDIWPAWNVIPHTTEITPLIPSKPPRGVSYEVGAIYGVGGIYGVGAFMGVKKTSCLMGEIRNCPNQTSFFAIFFPKLAFCLVQKQNFVPSTSSQVQQLEDTPLTTDICPCFRAAFNTRTTRSGWTLVYRSDPGVCSHF